MSDASSRARKFPRAIDLNQGAAKPSEEPKVEAVDPKIASVPVSSLSRQTTALNLGILTPLYQNPGISEIMVNDLRPIMIEQEGKIFSTGACFANAVDLYTALSNIVVASGRNFTKNEPFYSGVLPDGSRFQIILPPVSRGGPSLTIRKYVQRHNAEDLIQRGTLTSEISYFLNACVVGKLSVLFSGGTGSGKTTLLNVCANMIPRAERIITIEDTPEISIPHVNSVSLHTQATAGLHARDLLSHTLRMRPDRILLGECRGAEALEVLQIMNTGHEGSMTTIHANSPRDALSRFETLCLMAGLDLSVATLRKMISEAFDVIVQVERTKTGHRRVSTICEITGMESDIITLQDIFVCKDENGPAGFSGYVPTFVAKLRARGVNFPEKSFK